MTDAERTDVQVIAEEMGVGGLLVRRWLGTWIDSLALAAIIFLPAMGLGAFFQLDDQTARYAVLGLIVLAVLYFPVLEGISGRTLGKLITGLKVVDKDGRAPGFGRAIVRTLFRLLEVNPILLGGVPAGIAVLATKRRQRLGDLVAGAYVIPVDRLKQMADVDATLAAMRSGPT